MAVLTSIFYENHALSIGCAIVLVILIGTRYLRQLLSPIPTTKGPVPVSVNYFFSRKCNYTCEFCFHTAKTSHVESLSDAQRGLRLLQQAGMRKINFAGGEPFLYKPMLAALCRYCKVDLRLESVSIISNASKIDEAFLAANARYIDILAVSCDSFDDATNARIGRMDARGPIQVANLYRVAAWCRNYNIMFKLNTVVCSYNVHEDMNDAVARLAPFRWKVFQVLLVPGENDSEKTKRDTRRLLISDEAFEAFCRRHSALKECMVPEPNRLMRSSYLLLDEYMRFLDKEKGTESESILKVGVAEALNQIKWGEDDFVERGGFYDWTKDLGEEEAGGCSSELAKELEF